MKPITRASSSTGRRDGRAGGEREDGGELGEGSPLVSKRDGKMAEGAIFVREGCFASAANGVLSIEG